MECLCGGIENGRGCDGGRGWEWEMRCVGGG